MYILGISCYYHDAAAVLLKDGILIAAADEERFSRKKHDASFPRLAIRFCLQKANISTSDLTYVVFYEKPFLKFERIFLNSLRFAPQSFHFFRESMKEWFFDKLWIKSHIINELHIPQNKVLFSEHHVSHAASSFFSSPFQKSALLTIDGVDEWTTTAWGVGDGTNITLKEEIRFPHSLGLLYSTFTEFVGFEMNEGEYKVMGLAPYGKPKYVDKIYKLIDRADDGSYSLKLRYFSYPSSLTKVYTKAFEKLFGTKNTTPDEVVTYYADIAASIQYVLEEILVKIANYVYEQTKLDTLCYAGGVALNSSANWKIFQKTKFKHIYIQPAAGDSGGALGAALWAYHSVCSKKRVFVMNHTFYGQAEDETEVKATLENEKVQFKKISNANLLIEEVIEKLLNKKVVGWVQNEFEWGPRALGHRSILADPRKKVMKHLVNEKIKFREAFRPFAPSVAIEKTDNYFDIGKSKDESPFKFMLYVVPVTKNKRQNLEAITHEDGTARPQFVEKETNPLYHKLLTNFGQKTGDPILLNTSFNLKGEPIVNTTKEALKTFYRSGLDALVIDNFIIEKK